MKSVCVLDCRSDKRSDMKTSLWDLDWKQSADESTTVMLPHETLFRTFRLLYIITLHLLLIYSCRIVCDTQQFANSIFSLCRCVCVNDDGIECLIKDYRCKCSKTDTDLYRACTLKWSKVKKFNKVIQNWKILKEEPVHSVLSCLILKLLRLQKLLIVYNYSTVIHHQTI